MEATGRNDGGGCGANLARLGNGLDYFGARFSNRAKVWDPITGTDNFIVQLGFITLRNGMEADLSICLPKLLERMLGAGKDTRFAEEARMHVWGTKGEVDCGVLRRATKVAGHSRRFVAKVLAGAIYTRNKALKFGTVDDDDCPVCIGVADTQQHRVMDCRSSNKEGDKKGRQAWSSLADGGSRNIPERAATVM